jgi:PAS domain S-box-containing protein
MPQTPNPVRTPLSADASRADAAGAWEAISELLPSGIVVFGADGRMRLANPMAGALLGRSPEPGELRAHWVARLDPSCGQLAHLGSGGTVVVVAGGRLVEVGAREHRGGMLWTIQDRSSELRLRAQLTEQASMVAHSHEAFMVIDQQGYIRYANRFCETERGFDAHGLVGRNLAQIERPCGPGFDDARDQSPEELRARLQQVLKNDEPSTYNAWHRRRDGNELPVEATLRPHRVSQETVLLLAARDDSRRLMHLQALTQAKAEAEAANRAKSAFLAVTSHELRTPLTGIIGFCDLLQLDFAGGPEESQRHLKLISESSHHLLAIINDIVDLSKIEARTLEIRTSAVDPEEAVDLAAQLWRRRAETKGIAVVRKPSVGSGGGTITTDPQRLRQLLDNLMSNAVKFTEKGRVELSLEHRHDGIEITIADTGIGVPERAGERIFQAFWQVADHHTRSAGGNGLGLYICKNLAELMGGRVWLHGSSSAGSVFKVRLPLSCAMKNARLMKSDVWLHSPKGMEPVPRMGRT